MFRAEQGRRPQHRGLSPLEIRLRRLATLPLAPRSESKSLKEAAARLTLPGRKLARRLTRNQEDVGIQGRRDEFAERLHEAVATKRMKGVVISDLDWTVLHDGASEIPEDTQSAFLRAKERGQWTMINTSRPAGRVDDIAVSIDAFTVSSAEGGVSFEPGKMESPHFKYVLEERAIREYVQETVIPNWENATGREPAYIEKVEDNEVALFDPAWVELNGTDEVVLLVPKGGLTPTMAAIAKDRYKSFKKGYRTVETLDDFIAEQKKLQAPNYFAPSINHLLQDETKLDYKGRNWKSAFDHNNAHTDENSPYNDNPPKDVRTRISKGRGISDIKRLFEIPELIEGGEPFPVTIIADGMTDFPMFEAAIQLKKFYGDKIKLRIITVGKGKEDRKTYDAVNSYIHDEIMKLHRTMSDFKDQSVVRGYIQALQEIQVDFVEHFSKIAPVIDTIV